MKFSLLTVVACLIFFSNLHAMDNTFRPECKLPKTTLANANYKNVVIKNFVMYVKQRNVLDVLVKTFMEKYEVSSENSQRTKLSTQFVSEVYTAMYFPKDNAEINFFTDSISKENITAYLFAGDFDTHTINITPEAFPKIKERVFGLINITDRYFQRYLTNHCISR